MYLYYRSCFNFCSFSITVPIFRVNREEIIRKDWMFKLVGGETFNVGKSKTQCTIKIEPVGGFTYQYTLEVEII